VIHLDTNVLIEALVPGTAADQSLRRWLLAGESVGMSSIAWAEFLCGAPARHQEPSARREAERSLARAAQRLIGQPATFDGEAASLAAELFNSGGRRRGSLGDCMVAAVALRRGAALATRNHRDFDVMKAAGLILLEI
jgi:predicted nucleic acid-binding protein